MDTPVKLAVTSGGDPSVAMQPLASKRETLLHTVRVLNGV